MERRCNSTLFHLRLKKKSSASGQTIVIRTCLYAHMLCAYKQVRMLLFQIRRVVHLLFCVCGGATYINIHIFLVAPFFVDCHSHLSDRYAMKCLQ